MFNVASSGRAWLTAACLASVLSACENTIPGGSGDETIIYENHVVRANGNKPGSAATGGSGTVNGGGSGMGGQGGGPLSPEEICPPARAAEPEKVPQRAIVSDGATAAPQPKFTSELWDSFAASGCTKCHAGGQSLGDWGTDKNSFPTDPRMTEGKVLERLTTLDPLRFMPPQTPLLNTRGPNDPLRQFADILKVWLDAGHPPDLFYPPAPPVAAEKRYLMTPELASSLTNIGNCIPNRLIVGTEPTRAEELDALFQKATKLPERLEETDLVSLDSAVLARQNVFAFAPAYPLWADDAKKIRHVRVPMGQSIKYDPATKNFEIPENTRFYKTFLKKVIDASGNVRFRKIETRLIVARMDKKRTDGTKDYPSLTGTYLWEDDESQAKLYSKTFNDGTGFKDYLKLYATDEPQQKAILEAKPADMAAQLRKVQRNYAVPSLNRCVQCHQGSPNSNFILGFTPLQLGRRPLGEGGTIEEAGPDEMNQLQRLIDYGVITGLADAGAVPKLEDSQGARKPRNKYELEAQGYLLGNCSHCHNPQGYPSIRFGELAQALNFLPDGDKGGIFQFPLDKMSPRTKRKVSTDPRIPGRKRDSVDVPYITPSLFDIGYNELDPTGKARPKKFINGVLAGSRPPRSKQLGVFDPADNSTTYPHADSNVLEPVDAPWRSLIYRNVDAPFTYVEDQTVFPHMPLHTSGYDCRARQIVGNWMVSIPARLKGPVVKYSPNGTEPAVTASLESRPTSCDIPLYNPTSISTPAKPCPICGDSVVADKEICDDGMQCAPGGKRCFNNSDCAGVGACKAWDGDGCSADCFHTEPGFFCAKNSSGLSECVIRADAAGTDLPEALRCPAETLARTQALLSPLYENTVLSQAVCSGGDPKCTAAHTSNCETCTGNVCADPQLKPGTTGLPTAAQPYVEFPANGAWYGLDAFTGQIGGSYQQAVAEAEERLKIWQAGERYNSCPNNDDIIDPLVAGNVITPPAKPVPFGQISLGIPDHAHFVPTDLTEDLSMPWLPRGKRWDEKLGADPNAIPMPEVLKDTSPDELEALKLLREVAGLDAKPDGMPTSFREFANTPLPYGNWKDVCNYPGAMTAQVFKQAPDPYRWVTKEKDATTVYPQLPGEAVFRMVCINCHGAEADSKGSLAEMIGDMTGGATKVANLKDGFFGPPTQKGGNLARVFDPPPPLLSPSLALGLDVDSYASRYMAWMALGGTSALIPPEALERVVDQTLVLGEPRRNLDLSNASPNMLQAVMELCRAVLPGVTLAGTPAVAFDFAAGAFLSPAETSNKGLGDFGFTRSPLFTNNGDAELLQRLCSFANAPPVRALKLYHRQGVGAGNTLKEGLASSGLYEPKVYGQVPVGRHDGTVTVGIDPTNRLPWCLDPLATLQGPYYDAIPSQKTDPVLQAAAVTEYAKANTIAGQPLPICPPSVSPASAWNKTQQDRWARRGAINGGLAVYLFLKKVTQQGYVSYAYDSCPGK